ncbi:MULTISPECIES: precorrin-4 C(11)-methyltransferase [Parabacteroides]|jgi:precorrin-4 C(11)-methyltransferase|uniref:Precorrin-4 C11-methyltransferase n=1 Tax=Parabacteroides faecis TaxID=1217282 RepID=A0ABR6KIZ6_9BACT|nr:MULTISPECIES: precorrin-4 C(11)-methyltransferase [Parabacteroides]MBB4621474.1 precorrin-4 C11-methyltransferase [Parabacteroides faecis]RHR36105.1 precorrin-4 C(11)-methyltransferase [Parabacteroides sp. AF18-52]GGJ85731.1 precorrin-4 C(11)-methyltransferase [Parabacteroides faecis]
MNKKSIAIVVVSVSSLPLARQIKKQYPNAVIYSKESQEETVVMKSIDSIVGDLFLQSDAIIFIGAMGICVRCIAPYVMDKHTDPAVICIDSTGKYIIPVLSGHIGGANELSIELAQILGGNAIVTTQSDNTGLWALDTLAEKFDWSVVADDLTDNENAMNACIAAFVNKRPTALLLNIRDKGTEYLEQSRPEHVQIFNKFSDIPLDQFELVITVGPFIYEAEIKMISYFPKVLHLGIGCRKGLNGDPKEMHQHIISTLIDNNLCPESLADISSIDLKKDEVILALLSYGIMNRPFKTYPADTLDKLSVPNPSAKVKEVTQSSSVAEAAAIQSAGGGLLLLEKQKGRLGEHNDYTFAVAMDKSVQRQGHIEIVGAGPGDPELISIRGRRMLEKADLILYAGSLVPKELTFCAKPGATVRSSADMNLEEQFLLMKEFYDKGKFIVRLHTGDPCIYGAIQEQMAFFDQYNMSYHITPGISSFQAAAAALQSQFTIPEKVQTIILTRGEGRTPMPEKEQLHKLAASQSTMCIYLSAGIADKVQEELLQHYAPTTPVAACYKLTWKDERIYRGELKDLAKIVKDNHLTLTTLLVVGDAIDNREGLSRLYADEFKHLFRK